MSEESSDLTKSWVVVDSVKTEDTPEDTPLTSAVEEVEEPQEPHGDSDTDSISVISESGCSFKDDEEEIVPALTNEEENKEVPKEEDIEKENNKENEIPDAASANKSLVLVHPPKIENPLTEKFYYFATSAVCAILLIGFSVVVQHYFDTSSHINNFESDQPKHISPNIPRFIKNGNDLKRKSAHKFEKSNKITKLGSDFKIASLTPQVEDNAHTIRDLKSNFKPPKNKNPDVKFNKENCDAAERHKKTEDYEKKMKALKMREVYLNKKEKYLIEKEHDLLKKEIKLNKDKKPYRKKEEKKHNDDHIKKRKDKDKKNNESNCKKHRSHEVNDDRSKKRNISGHWYSDLHRARDYLREKEHVSDWVFDRARLRSMKRNKAHWYFQWMVDRARHRKK